jgi:hypothetical protein
MSKPMPKVNGPKRPNQSKPEEQHPQWQQPTNPPAPENYYPPAQQSFPSTQYPYTQPSPYQPLPPVFPRPPKKRSRRNLWIAAIVIVAIISVIAYSSQATTSTPSLSQADQTATADAAFQQTAVSASNAVTPFTGTPTPIVTDVPVTPAPTFVTFTDGNYQVGSDIQPGTYRTRTGSPGCYYERLKGFSGTLGDILANNNTDNPAIITILPTDKGFNSQNCGTWTKDLSQITTSKTTFDDGMYIIGTDIKPGTYKSSGSQGCYYARLSGFTGTLDSILANNNTDNVAIVTIYASDKGFESNNCGTWTRI